jgi:hypothetical protein
LGIVGYYRKSTKFGEVPLKALKNSKPFFVNNLFPNKKFSALLVIFPLKKGWSGRRFASYRNQ